MDLSDRILKFNILSDNKIGQGLKMKKVSEILKKYKVAVIFAGFAVFMRPKQNRPRNKSLSLRIPVLKPRKI